MNGFATGRLTLMSSKKCGLRGFTHLNLSLVSTNTPLLKKSTVRILLKKPRSRRKAAALGFKTVAYQILGIPGIPSPR